MSYGSYLANLASKLRPTVVALPNPRVYRALLNQDGTTAIPTAIVLENSLGGTIVWTRVSEGIYLGTLTGAFVNNKTFLHLNTGKSVNGFEGVERVDNNSIRVSTYLLTSVSGPTYSDGRLSPAGACLEIMVYN